MIDKKYVIRGYNWRIDPRARRMMKSEFVDLIYDISGLVPWAEHTKTRDEVDRFIDWVERQDVMKQLSYLRNEVSAWIARTRLGLPPTVPESAFDLEEDEVFVKLEPMIIAEVARRLVKK